jgi:hypothetical protein
LVSNLLSPAIGLACKLCMLLRCRCCGARLTTSDAEEPWRWRALIGPRILGRAIYHVASMTPSSLQPPIMMSIATGSPSRLAMLFAMSEQSGAFPVYSPNGGVSVS